MHLLGNDATETTDPGKCPQAKSDTGQTGQCFRRGNAGPGFGTQSGGSKTWSALFYVSGKPRYKKLGRYPILSLAQARDAARKFLENPQKAVSETEAGTFQDVSDNFMKRYVEANGLRSKREIARTLSKTSCRAGRIGRSATSGVRT